MDVPLSDVGKLILYNLPRSISYTFPFSTIVGGLMTIGRFIANNEFLAMRAAGVSYKRIFLPFLILTFGFTLISFSFNDYFIPWGTVNATRLKAELSQANPELVLEPYSVKTLQKRIIMTGDIENKVIYDLVIFDKTNENGKRMITAKSARIAPNPDQQDVISLQLFDVFSQTVYPNQRNELNYFNSDEMIYNILLSEIDSSMLGISSRDMRTYDLYKEIQQKRKVLDVKIIDNKKAIVLHSSELRIRYLQLVNKDTNINHESGPLQSHSTEFDKLKSKKIFDRSLHSHLLEINNKVALPFGCLAFILLAFPSGLFSKRNGRAIGFFIGIIFTIIYWGFIYFGYYLGTRTSFSPALAMWLPNIIIVSVSLIFLILRFKR